LTQQKLSACLNPLKLAFASNLYCKKKKKQNSKAFDSHMAQKISILQQLCSCNIVAILLEYSVLYGFVQD